MVEHKQLPTELDRYELSEVYVHWDNAAQPRKVIRITLHGRNIWSRALEPEIRIGDMRAHFPEIASDERSISGFLTEPPKDGAPITLVYGGQIVAWLREQFSRRMLRTIDEPPPGRTSVPE